MLSGSTSVENCIHISQRLSIEFSFDPVVLLHCIFPWNTKYKSPKMYIHLFIKAVRTISRILKKPKYSKTDEEINNMFLLIYKYTYIYMNTMQSQK